jgi:hypothetical protein
MDSVPDREHDHLRLLQQLKGASIPFSLTILSIIQGVALAALAAVVAACYRDFSLVTWVLALTTLAMIGVVYFHIGIDVIGWVWIPTMSDAAVPFLIGAEELFLSYTITGPLGVWLLGFVAIHVSSVLGHAHVLRKARAEWDNAPLLPYLEHHRRFALRLTTAGAALLLALALGSLVAGLGGREPVQGRTGLTGLVIGLLALGWLGGYAYRLTRHWEGVIRYARTGHLPDA